ncbi:hypothetical protein DFH09DRAFT_1471066 [Mycena vulgaris]|nr:hypothetical protein DFH09DRAFT_1471066 [Mycena vulgaris]
MTYLITSRPNTRREVNVASNYRLRAPTSGLRPCANIPASANPPSGFGLFGPLAHIPVVYVSLFKTLVQHTLAAAVRRPLRPDEEICYLLGQATSRVHGLAWSPLNVVLETLSSPPARRVDVRCAVTSPSPPPRHIHPSSSGLAILPDEQPEKIQTGERGSRGCFVLPPPVLSPVGSRHFPSLSCGHRPPVAFSARDFLCLDLDSERLEETTREGDYVTTHRLGAAFGPRSFADGQALRQFCELAIEVVWWLLGGGDCGTTQRLGAAFGRRGHSQTGRLCDNSLQGAVW